MKAMDSQSQFDTDQAAPGAILETIERLIDFCMKTGDAAEAEKLVGKLKTISEAASLP